MRVSFYWYRLTSAVHWRAREAVIRNMLERFRASSKRQCYRIVDLGCGLGSLAETASALGFQYLGIDNDADRIGHCRATYGHLTQATFVAGDCATGALDLRTSDIAVLNGAVHHLDDEAMQHVLGDASRCAAIVIADHLKVERPTAIAELLPALFQWLDFGDFVRPYTYFATLQGFTLHDSESFSFGFGRVPAWKWFCNLYLPALEGGVPYDRG